MAESLHQHGRSTPPVYILGEGIFTTEELSRASCRRLEGYTVFRSERCKNVVPPRTGVARKAVWGVVKQYRLLFALRVVTSTI